MGYPNLKAEMARSGVSTSDVAAACGKTRHTVYRYLHSGDGFSFKSAEQVRDALFPGMTVDYLFGEKEVITNGLNRDNPAGG